MTLRERASVALTVAGAAAMTVAAGGIGGRWWAVAVGGASMLGAGVLLGLDDTPAGWGPSPARVS